MQTNAKREALCLAKILYETDGETNFLSTNQLVEILQEKYGIKSNRIKILSNIRLLRQYGMDIQTVRSKSIMFNLKSRKFDTPESKLLIDAVASWKVITEKKSEMLIKKLSSLKD